MYFTPSPDGWNDWSYQWIAYSDWTYSREFQLPKITDQTVLLKVEGLDTVATIRWGGLGYRSSYKVGGLGYRRNCKVGGLDTVATIRWGEA